VVEAAKKSWEVRGVAEAAGLKRRGSLEPRTSTSRIRTDA
jgi:hypothetical protein